LWAQQLPQLIGYARPRPTVAPALAYRLYQDATLVSERVERCAASVVRANQRQGIGGSSASKGNGDERQVPTQVSHQMIEPHIPEADIAESL
jgi:hypothetical protein